MKISNINNSFKGIYKTSFNYKEEPLKYNILDAFEYNNNVKIVYNHQSSSIVGSVLVEALKDTKEIPSLEWFIQHAKNKGYKLPKYITDFVHETYALTDEDKVDYEKMQKPSWKSKSDFGKILKQEAKNAENEEPWADVLARAIIKFDKQEQAKFDKFLEKREIEPLVIDIVV